MKYHGNDGILLLFVFDKMLSSISIRDRRIILRNLAMPHLQNHKYAHQDKKKEQFIL